MNEQLLRQLKQNILNISNLISSGKAGIAIYRNCSGKGCLLKQAFIKNTSPFFSMNWQQSQVTIKQDTLYVYTLL
jgi:hypothetical protein